MRITNLAATALSAIFLGTQLHAAVVVDDAGTARNGKVGYWSSLVARNGDVAISYYCEDDHAGNPPEMYTLRFAWATGNTWQWTTVDPNYAGSDTSMARGSDGLYRIVYQNWDGAGLAVGSTTNWTVTPIAIPAGVVPANLSMALDAGNRPHMVYMNLANGGDRSLRYTYFDGSQWRPGSINNGIIATNVWTPTIGFSNTYVAFDRAGVAHVAYAEPSDAMNAYGPIRYLTLAGGIGGAWQSESVGLLGVDPSFAIGNDNVPRMVINADAGIVYAHKAGGVWQFETIVPAEWGSSNALALGPDNAPVVSFGLGADEDMYLARRGASGWTVTRIDGDGTPGPHEILGRYGTSVAIDESGRTHVSYLAIDIYSSTHRCDLRYDGPGAGQAPCVTIDSSPAPASPCVSGSAAFAVSALSNDPLRYQWRRNGVALSDGPAPGGAFVSGSNTQNLTLFGVSAADEGMYDCVVDADCGGVVSQSAALTIAPPATVLTPPTSVTACDGASVAFSITASGDAVTIAWYRDGTQLVDGSTGAGSIISGATTATLTISGVGLTDSGSYVCAVSNVCGADVSDAATLGISTCGGCAEDLDGDGAVGLSDLAILLSHFGDTGVTHDDGDIDRDDDVDLADLAALLSHFGETCQ